MYGRAGAQTGQVSVEMGAKIVQMDADFTDHPVGVERVIDVDQDCSGLYKKTQYPLHDLVDRPVDGGLAKEASQDTQPLAGHTLRFQKGQITRGQRPALQAVSISSKRMSPLN